MKFRAAIILLALLASSACYIYGVLHQTNNKIYTGVRSLNASDYNQNTSWIDQSREGHFLMKNKFTAEPQAAVFVRPVYYLLSQPFRFTSLSNTVVLHILRILSGMALLILLFPILKQYDSESQIVNRAFLLLVFSSGIGFAVRQWISPTDWNVPESVLFLSLGEVPHFAYSLLFLWAGIASVYAGSPLALFVALLILWWEHPFEAAILLCVAFANLWALGDRKKQILTCIVLAGVSLPPFLYYQHLKKTAAFSGWGSAQNLMPSPNIACVVAGFLPLILLGILGFLYLRKQPGKVRLLRFLTIWIIVQFVMIYLPFPFQRRLIAGLQFPFALLSAYALSNFRKFALVAVIAICSIGNIWITKTFIEEMKPRQMPYYLSSSYSDAFRWLSNQDKETVVLSGFVTGNFIPGFTGLTSYMGHSSLTPNIAAKKAAAIEFYQKPSMDFLLQNRIGYVFWGLEERHLAPMPLDNVLEVAYKNDEVTILLPQLRRNSIAMNRWEPAESGRVPYAGRMPRLLKKYVGATLVVALSKPHENQGGDKPRPYKRSKTFSTDSAGAHFETAIEIEALRPKIELMKIVVGGHSRNIGKTSVVAGIIRAMPEMDWTAMKITQFGHGICSRNGRACHCSTEEHRYAIVEETDPGGRGDSCRFLSAGAKRSLWVRTKQGMLSEAMGEINTILQQPQNTIIESNSILEFFKPDLYLVVLDYSNADFKPSARKYLELADACILIHPVAEDPKWEFVRVAEFSHKPSFKITPPVYVDESIVEFVRRSL